MCGIFGITRTSRKAESDKDFAAIAFGLGVKSEERGRHSSGIAMLRNNSNDTPVVHKELKPFRKLNFKNVSQHIVRANTIIGHTRFATQGSASDIKNASPLVVGTICGTHNGDIDKSTVPVAAKISDSTTDTARLYEALQSHVPGSSEFIKILETAVGRMALGFTSTKLPNALVLIRGAISPLAYSYTANGTLAYASNPNWFRLIEESSLGQVAFKNITLVPEGKILIFSTLTNELLASYNFTPQCRESDLYLVNSSGYKNFTLADRKAFNSISFHNVVLAKVEKHPAAKVVAGFTPIEPDFYTAEEGALFDDFFLRGESDQPFTPEPDELEEGRVAQEHLDVLCSIPKNFDEEAYVYMLESDDEAELESRYSEVVFRYLNESVTTEKEMKQLDLPEPLFIPERI